VSKELIGPSGIGFANASAWDSDQPKISWTLAPHVFAGDLPVLARLVGADVGDVERRRRFRGCRRRSVSPSRPRPARSPLPCVVRRWVWACGFECALLGPVSCHGFRPSPETVCKHYRLRNGVPRVGPRPQLSSPVASGCGVLKEGPQCQAAGPPALPTSPLDAAAATVTRRDPLAPAAGPLGWQASWSRRVRSVPGRVASRVRDRPSLTGCLPIRRAGGGEDGRRAPRRIRWGTDDFWERAGGAGGARRASTRLVDTPRGQGEGIEPGPGRNLTVARRDPNRGTNSSGDLYRRKR
jgi:hypothetical protein